MNPLADASTIDHDVRALVADGVSVYKLDADAIRALQPDFVITQSQCELCAVSLGEVEATLLDWLAAAEVDAAQVVSLEPMALTDVAVDIDRVGVALGVREKAAALNAQMADGFAALRAQTAALATHKVFFMEWTVPLMGAGNWMPETIAAAGGAVVLGQEGVHSQTVSMADIAAADPDVIVVGPCGFSIERAAQELAPLTPRDDWQALRAVRDGQVYLVNGNHFFNRPGPRLLQSAQIIAEILYPDVFLADNHGTGWLRHA
jgi:iron complex transport system substrate-binding protein